MDDGRQLPYIAIGDDMLILEEKEVKAFLPIFLKINAASFQCEGNA